MKYSLLLLILCFTGINAATARGDKEQIEGLLLAQKDAWNRGDIEGYMQGYWKSDDLIFVGKSGVTKGWQSTLERYKKSYPDKRKMGQLDFSFELIDVINDQEAFVLGKWALKRQDGDMGGYFTLRLKKIDNSWKVVLDHSS